MIDKLKELKELLGDTYKDLLEAYLDDGPKRLDQMRSAFQDFDFETLATLAAEKAVAILEGMSIQSGIDDERGLKNAAIACSGVSFKLFSFSSISSLNSVFSFSILLSRSL